MPASSRNRIQFTHRPHPLRLWIVVGAGTALTAVAWVLAGSIDSDEDVRGAVALHPRATGWAPVAGPHPFGPAVSSMPVGAARAPAVAAGASALAPPAMPTALPIREAPDSGRAQ